MRNHSLPILALVLVACGGAVAPTAARTDAVAAIRSAEDHEARAEPQASLHLELAQEQLATAQTLIERGQMVRAERMLMRAEADAELAVALAQLASVRSEADTTREHIRETRERTL